MPTPRSASPPTLSLRSDNHLWLPLVAHAIASETGDRSFLEQEIPFLADDHASPDGQGTVWDHLMAAVQFTWKNRGAHGLPLTFQSDWNDIIGRFNRRGQGETVFAGMQYVFALRKLIELAEWADKPDLQHLQEYLV